ncbi:PREDICTED: dnaJ homolog subfamily B member 6-like isoform X2 [Lupinus angustifolius]|uniref:dnaJ homolog subfamily B member 6-like isoform X2 n=1 Tax=Lupinus angustifolius TaxID=3871 RepID=UPI00092F3239|nr:PREDICTED: dnaJ homolog subfamily B member 6-like isoform X2 [Lupinus angustifolius]
MLGTMASEGDKDNDFYGVLGLNKECTESELRIAYKKLALKWHPDRCSASGNSKFVEEAKKKFQAIQQAYSVLSDANKRLMYDVGVYDSDDDENGMGDFLNEMVAMMSQTKPNENGGESFEELQQLFQDMFQDDIGSNGNTSHTASGCSASSTYMTFSETSNSNKRNSSEMNFGKVDDSFNFNGSYQNFCFGTGETPSRYQQGKGRNHRRRR